MQKFALRNGPVNVHSFHPHGRVLHRLEVDIRRNVQVPRAFEDGVRLEGAKKKKRRKVIERTEYDINRIVFFITDEVFSIFILFFDTAIHA